MAYLYDISQMDKYIKFCGTNDFLGCLKCDFKGFITPKSHICKDVCKSEVYCIYRNSEHKCDSCFGNGIISNPYKSYCYPISCGPRSYINGGFTKSTLLHEYAITGNLEEMQKLLIHNNVNLNIVNTQYLTPIDLAAIHGHIYIIKLLIQKGANINLTFYNITNNTTLTYAVQNNYYKIVKYLVNNGADINFLGQTYSQTAIIIAVKNGNYKIFKYLINNGGIFLDYPYGFIIMDNAIYGKNIKIINYLLNNINIKKEIINYEKGTNLSIFTSIIKSENLEIVKLLVNAGLKLFPNKSKKFMYCIKKANDDIKFYLSQILIVRAYKAYRLKMEIKKRIERKLGIKIYGSTFNIIMNEIKYLPGNIGYLKAMNNWNKYIN